MPIKPPKKKNANATINHTPTITQASPTSNPIERINKNSPICVCTHHYHNPSPPSLHYYLPPLSILTESPTRSHATSHA